MIMPVVNLFLTGHPLRDAASGTQQRASLRTIWAALCGRHVHQPTARPPYSLGRESESISTLVPHAKAHAQTDEIELQGRVGEFPESDIGLR